MLRFELAKRAMPIVHTPITLLSEQQCKVPPSYTGLCVRILLSESPFAFPSLSFSQPGSRSKKSVAYDPETGSFLTPQWMGILERATEPMEMLALYRLTGNDPINKRGRRRGNDMVTTFPRRGRKEEGGMEHTEIGMEREGAARESSINKFASRFGGFHLRRGCSVPSEEIRCHVSSSWHVAR